MALTEEMPDGRGSVPWRMHGAGGVPQWFPFFYALAEHYELLVPEHPGFGGSDDPPWIHSMSDLAMFYLDLVEEAGLDAVGIECDVVLDRGDRRVGLLVSPDGVD